MTTPKFSRGELNTYPLPDQVSQVSRALRGVSKKISLVPTMGALHAGHRELLRRAKRVPNTVVAASIFVNPLQFGPNEDFAAYPRPLEDDLAVLAEAGVEIAFTPEAADLYSDGAAVTVHPGPLGDELEGASRPGHFAGVLTVVAKLFNLFRPDYVFFGEKDYQQLVLIKRMVADLNFDTRVIGVPTVREHDGLALSSRNVYLTHEQREDAVVLSAALTSGAVAGRNGAEAVLEAAWKTLAARPAVEVDYLELRGTDLGPAPVDGDARLLIAARLGGRAGSNARKTRLIDNVPVVLGKVADHPARPGLDAGE